MLKHVHMKVKVSSLKEKVTTGVHKLGYIGEDGAGTFVFAIDSGLLAGKDEYMKRGRGNRRNRDCRGGMERALWVC